jgi:hypothetical protein
MAEPDRAVDVNPACIGSAMSESVGHGIDDRCAHRSFRVEIKLSGDPTHDAAL